MRKTQRRPSQIVRLPPNDWPYRKNFTRAERIQIIRDQRGLCKDLAEGCIKNINLDNCEIDHKQELADGGSNKRSNLQALCIPCHKFKTNTSKLNRNLEKKQEEEEKRKQTKKAWVSKIQQQKDMFIRQVADDGGGNLYKIEPEAAYWASILAKKDSPEMFYKKQMNKIMEYPPGHGLEINYNTRWYTGTIMQVNLLKCGIYAPEYTFDINYGCGEIEENVSYDRLRRLA